MSEETNLTEESKQSNSENEKLRELIVGVLICSSDFINLFY